MFTARSPGADQRTVPLIEGWPDCEAEAGGWHTLEQGVCRRHWNPRTSVHPTKDVITRVHAGSEFPVLRNQLGTSWATRDGEVQRTGGKLPATSAPVVSVTPGNLTPATHCLASGTRRIDARGNRSTYTYDAVDQLLVRRYPNGTRATFAYDAVGNRTQLVNQAVTATMIYDSLNSRQDVTTDYKL